jgi:hypothetical protein
MTVPATRNWYSSDWLLCLDEFERLQEPVRAGWGIHFLDGLRHWLQHRPLFALMFTGSHTFEQLGPVWTDRFLSARCLKVSFLKADDVPRCDAGSSGTRWTQNRRRRSRPDSRFRLRRCAVAGGSAAQHAR